MNKYEFKTLSSRKPNDNIVSIEITETKIREKSVGTTELDYSTKKRKHCLTVLKAFFVRPSSEYETSDSDRKVNPNI